jgi:hypothetical protein
MGDVITLFSKRKISDDGTEQQVLTVSKESTLDVGALTESYKRNQERQREERKKNNASVTRSYNLTRKPKS